MKKQKLKIVFAGTPEIAAIVLQAILDHGFDVDLVLTKPDSIANRGKKLTMSAVKSLAIKYQLAVLTPSSLKNNKEMVRNLEEIKPDIMIVVAYGLILPQEILTIPKLGCINIHVSLLPRFRGAAPIQRAILAGDDCSGVTIMQMDKGLDTGDILLKSSLTIADDETSGTLHDKLALLGATLLLEYLNNYQDIKPVKQSEDGVCYADKILKSEAELDFNEKAQIIERKIRAFNPYPGALADLEGVMVKIWQAKIVKDAKLAPGAVKYLAKSEIVVGCGEGTALSILELQLPGKKRVKTHEYLNGIASVGR